MAYFEFNLSRTMRRLSINKASLVKVALFLGMVFSVVFLLHLISYYMGGVVYPNEIAALDATQMPWFSMFADSLHYFAFHAQCFMTWFLVNSIASMIAALPATYLLIYLW